MTITIKTAVSLPQALFDQAGVVAQQLHISPSHLFEIAIEKFIRNYQSQPSFAARHEAYADQPDPDEQTTQPSQEVKPATQVSGEQRGINQGDIYWIQLEEPGESELGYYPHPYVVIQANIFNRSRIKTIVACALTSNIKRVTMPGNVLLEVGEANLPKQSVVEVSKVSTIDKTQLGDYIGTLTEQRVNQILAGMRFLQSSFLAR